MPTNIEITNDIITKNIMGSFILILNRMPNMNREVDRIMSFRCAMYHYVIINDITQKTPHFLDIADCIDSSGGDEAFFNYGEDKDLWLTQNDIEIYYKHNHAEKTKTKTTSQLHTLASKTMQNILKNKSYALMYLKDPLFKDVAEYKVNVMFGQDIPVYLMKVSNAKMTKFELIHGDDILATTKLDKQFIPYFIKKL